MKFKGTTLGVGLHAPIKRFHLRIGHQVGQGADLGIAEAHCHGTDPARVVSGNVDHGLARIHHDASGNRLAESHGTDEERGESEECSFHSCLVVGLFAAATQAATLAA